MSHISPCLFLQKERPRLFGVGTFLTFNFSIRLPPGGHNHLRTG